MAEVYASKKIGRKNVEEEWESITQEDFEKVRAGLEPLADPES